MRLVAYSLGPTALQLGVRSTCIVFAWGVVVKFSKADHKPRWTLVDGHHLQDDLVRRKGQHIQFLLFESTATCSQMANATLATIRSLALRDAEAWKTGINVDRGYAQIINEFAPVRLHQLLK
jgi:hypothetical protein